jgi:regulator of protease activity HflC (stomatin/prohibitin superfamily)
VAYQYLSDYAASVDIDRLIGPGREEITENLRTMIQRRLDELDVGIEVAFVGIRGAHPPAKSDVAATFQRVVSAQTGMASLINAANGEARKILTRVAGTEQRARALDEAIRVRNRLQAQSVVDEAALATANDRVESLLMGDASRGIAPVSGEAIALIADARAAATAEISKAAAKVRTFSTEVAAYRASPALYKERKRLDVYADMDHVRKYLILGDPGEVIIEYETTEQGGLDRVLSEATDRDKKQP